MSHGFGAACHKTLKRKILFEKISNPLGIFDELGPRNGESQNRLNFGVNILQDSLKFIL